MDDARHFAPPVPAASSRAVLVTASCAIAALLSACSPQARVLGGGSGPTLGGPVHLAPGKVEARFGVVGDASQILRESADDSFEAAGMSCEPGKACPVVDLSARLLQPAPNFTGTTPPIRVVELVVGYRPAGSAHATATLAYQRTVAVEGNLSTATWMRVSDALMNDVAADFAFRSQRSGLVVRLPSWALTTTSLTRTSSPRAFHVAITSDSRSDEDAIGTVGTREVRLARRATDYMTEMLADELRGAGHTIVPARDGRLVGSQLEKFWITSEHGFGGWETTAEIGLQLEVAPPPGIKRKKAELHSCKATTKTGQAPGEPELSQLLHRCLTELIESIRRDSAWSLGQG